MFKNNLKSTLKNCKFYEKKSFKQITDLINIIIDGNYKLDIVIVGLINPLGARNWLNFRNVYHVSWKMKLLLSQDINSTIIFFIQYKNWL